MGLMKSCDSFNSINRTGTPWIHYLFFFLWVKWMLYYRQVQMNDTNIIVQFAGHRTSIFFSYFYFLFLQFKTFFFTLSTWWLLTIFTNGYFVEIVILIKEANHCWDFELLQFIMKIIYIYRRSSGRVFSEN